MQAEEEQTKGAIANDNNNSDSDSDSELAASFSGQSLIASKSSDLRKAYVDQAERRLQHISDATKQIEDIDNSYMSFNKLLRTENGVLTTDDTKIRKFQVVYKARDEACEALIEKTKSLNEKFSQNVLTAIERGNKKNFTKNIEVLDDILKQDEKIIGKRSKKTRKTLIKIEEALNSYTIIPIEPEHSVIYQVGVLHHAKKKGVIDTQEFHTAVSVRFDQIPHAFRWREEKGKIIDISANFEKLAEHIDDYLEDESECYPKARQKFIKRVKGIREELDEKKVELDLEKLNALTLEKSPLEESTAAGTLKLEKIAATTTRHFYPLLPEEICTLSEIVPVNGSFSMGYPLESLAEDYDKSAKQARKKELRPEENMKYALQAQRVVNEVVAQINDNVVNGIPISHTVKGMFPKIRCIEEEYTKQTNEFMPANFSGTATEHLFSDYFKHLETKIKVLENNVKKYNKKSNHEKARDCAQVITKYMLIKTRAEKLRGVVLQGEEKIVLGVDIAVYAYGASSVVIEQFSQELKEKSQNELSLLKDQVCDKTFVTRNYPALNKIHEAERCLSGEKWRPLNDALSSCLDEKINFLEGKKETTIEEHQSLMSAIEADTGNAWKMRESVLTPLDFYQLPPREVNEKKTKDHLKEGAVTLLTGIFN